MSERGLPQDDLEAALSTFVEMISMQVAGDDLRLPPSPLPTSSRGVRAPLRFMGSAPPESLIHETLPYAAQWGILGILLLVAVLAIVYLVNKIFTMQDAHKADVAALHVAARDRESAIQDKRLREAAEYAGVLAELGSVLEGNTTDQQDIVKRLADLLAELSADARAPQRRKGASIP